MWKYILRPILFLFDPEKVHYFTLGALKWICTIPFVPGIIRKMYSSPEDAIEVFGLKFRNRVGLAAGLDKDGRYINELALFGFSHIEIGTITPRPQPGNDKPRLFRLPMDKAIINRMGFNNGGAEALRDRLKKISKPTDLVLGINIGKNKDTPLELAWQDYVTCIQMLHPYADYFTVNISSPNTPGLRGLQDKEPLTRLLSKIRDARNQLTRRIPVVVKIAPDMDDVQIAEIKDLVLELQLDGLIMGNTTLDRSSLKTPVEVIEAIGAGGLSGAPLTNKSLHKLKPLVHADKKIGVIAVGGIMDTDAARARVQAGADLIQVYTGFIYEGPALIQSLCQALATLRK